MARREALDAERRGSRGAQARCSAAAPVAPSPTTTTSNCAIGRHPIVSGSDPCLVCAQAALNAAAVSPTCWRVWLLILACCRSRSARRRRATPTSRRWPRAPASRRSRACTSSTWSSSAIRRRRRGRTSSCTRPKARRARRNRWPRASRRIRPSAACTFGSKPTARSTGRCRRPSSPPTATAPTATTTSTSTIRRPSIKVIRTNSIGVEFNGNAPDVRKPLTPEQFAAGLLLVKFLQERYGIPPERIYAHNWIDYKDARYCEGCELAERARAQGLSAGASRLTNQSAVCGVEAPRVRDARIRAARNGCYHATAHPAFRFARMRAAGAARRRAAPCAGSTSELEHELDRELHKMPPAAVLPSPETLACYERLGKIAAFRAAADPRRARAMRHASTWCGSTASLMPDQTLRSRSIRRRSCSAAWPRRWRNGSAPMSARPRPSSARRSPPSPISIPTSAAAATTSPAPSCPSTARATRIDIGAVKLKNGATFTLTDPLVSKPFREQMRTLACARFTTVLGPGSDGYHEEPHPSRSRRALARLSDLPVERARSGGARRRQCRCRVRGRST